MKGNPNFIPSHRRLVLHRCCHEISVLQGAMLHSWESTLSLHGNWYRIPFQNKIVRATIGNMLRVSVCVVFSFS